MLAGGHGFLIRNHGLACDNLLSVDIIAADGQLRTAARLHSALARRKLAGFQIDLAVVIRGGYDPAEGGLLFGAPTFASQRGGSARVSVLPA